MQHTYCMMLAHDHMLNVLVYICCSKKKTKQLAYSRRQKENDTFAEIAQALPVSADGVKELDKASILRVAIHYIKLRQFMGQGHYNQIYPSIVSYPTCITNFVDFWISHTHLSICLSQDLSLSFHLSVCLFKHLSVNLCSNLSVFIHLSVFIIPLGTRKSLNL